MARPQKEPLRPLTPDERSVLEHLARSSSERADSVARAKALLAVADGSPFAQAARAAGRREGDAVATLVARFNREGLAALLPRHGGGPAIRYGPKEQERILKEFHRPPDRERDGTATWSLTTLQRALRTAPDGLPTVSTWTLFQTLHRAGYSCQNSRTWCQTGSVVRKRKAGNVTVTDPDAARKRGGSSSVTGVPRRGAFPCGAKMRPGRIKRFRSPVYPGRRKGSRRVIPTRM